MKIFYFVLVIWSIGLHTIKAQTIITFTADQPSELVANAGSDTSAISGETVTLGEKHAVTGGTEPYSFLWRDGNAFISTEANPSVYPEETITYTLTVIDGNTCIATDDISISIGVTAINDFTADELRVYPNPATDRFTIETISEYGSASLITETGKLLWTKAVNGKTSFVAPRTPGVYLLKIEDGEKESVRRIVITK